MQIQSVSVRPPKGRLRAALRRLVPPGETGPWERYLESVEPALAVMREMMFGGKLSIAGHNGELLEEIRNYHRDEDFKIVKQRDDLVSALRYAIMARRSGKALSDCDGVGYGALPYAGQRSQQRQPQFARGTVNHPQGGIDPFTGQ